MLIDSHSHIDGKEFASDLPQLFERMKQADVVGSLIAGCSLKDYAGGLEFVGTHKNLWYATGVHPSTTDDLHEPSVEELVKLTSPLKVVAIGECGLDYYYDDVDPKVQKQRFITHIHAAIKAQLPLIIHSRDAKEDTIDLLRDEGADQCGFVLHCFTGDKQMAQDALNLGGYLSFSGILTFKSAVQIREVASWAPSDRILVETDCPYLAPVPYRGKRNEPSYVRLVAEKLAQLRGVSFETISQETTENFFRLFSKAKLS